MKKTVWLIGSGTMALDYAKVLKALDCDVDVIGRGDLSAREFEGKTGLAVIRGGLERFLEGGPELPGHAIVSVGVEELKNVSVHLVRYGVKNILVEKPAGLNSREIEELRQTATQQGARVFVAYNRRFYASVAKARDIIREDGGVTSFNFEFTEWSHVIGGLKKAPGVLDNWFLANSTHVVDLAFFLGGHPREMQCYTAGSLDWHPSASAFAGAGVSATGALFSYQANWAAPGRWGVEILTNKHRLIFKPLEKLQVQNIGSVTTEVVELDDKLDVDFKPGLYLQVKAFIDGNTKNFCTIEEQSAYCKTYDRMAGY